VLTQLPINHGGGDRCDEHERSIKASNRKEGFIWAALLFKSS